MCRRRSPPIGSKPPAGCVKLLSQLWRQRHEVHALAALQQGQNGMFVYVVQPDDTVQQRPVTVEQTLDGRALSSKHAHWQTLGHSLWWMWLIIAVPYVFLAATLLLGLKRLVRHDHRREIVMTERDLRALIGRRLSASLFSILLVPRPKANFAGGRQPHALSPTRSSR